YGSFRAATPRHQVQPALDSSNQSTVGRPFCVPHCPNASPTCGPISPKTAASISSERMSGPSFDQQLLDLRYGLSWIEPLGAGLGAIHDSVAAIEAERVLKIVKGVARWFVKAVGGSAIGLQKRGGGGRTCAVCPIEPGR